MKSVAKVLRNENLLKTSEEIEGTLQNGLKGKFGEGRYGRLGCPIWNSVASELLQKAN